jgi:hypothetical protein
MAHSSSNNKLTLFNQASVQLLELIPLFTWNVSLGAPLWDWKHCICKSTQATERLQQISCAWLCKNILPNSVGSRNLINYVLNLIQKIFSSLLSGTTHLEDSDKAALSLYCLRRVSPWTRMSVRKHKLSPETFWL